MYGIPIGLDGGHVPHFSVFVESDKLQRFPKDQARIYNVRKFELRSKYYDFYRTYAWHEHITAIPWRCPKIIQYFDRISLFAHMLRTGGAMFPYKNKNEYYLVFWELVFKQPKQFWEIADNTCNSLPGTSINSTPEMIQHLLIVFRIGYPFVLNRYDQHGVQATHNDNPNGEVA